jgi:hypothetical protein
VAEIHIRSGRVQGFSPRRSTLLHEESALEPAAIGRRPEEVIPLIDLLLAGGGVIRPHGYELSFLAVPGPPSLRQEGGAVANDDLRVRDGEPGA